MWACIRSMPISGKKERHELGYGLEVVNSSVASTVTKTKIITEAPSAAPADTRYPNGGSSMLTTGLYLSHSWKINEMFILSDGLRYSYNSLSCEFDTSSAVSNFQFPFTSVKQTNSALNGNLGLIIMPEKNVRFNVLGSTGFRAPNVEDMTKVFASAGSTVVVPNEKLKPEYAYNIEAGVATTVMDDRIKLEANYHYTLLKNAIVVKESQYNGKDSVMFNGALSQVLSSQNVDEAYIQGVKYL